MGRWPGLGPSRLLPAPCPISRSGSRNTPVGWVDACRGKVACSGLVFAEVTTAPRSRPKGSGKHLSRGSGPPLLTDTVFTCVCHDGGLLLPQMPLCLPHTLTWLQNHSGTGCPQSIGFRHRGSEPAGRNATCLLVEACRGRNPGTQPQVPSPEVGGEGPGLQGASRPSAWKAVATSVSRVWAHPATDQCGLQAFLGQTIKAGSRNS